MKSNPLPIKKAPRSAIQEWLLELPEDSLHRLRLINMNTRSSRHVILSLTYGLYDPHIRRLNRMITSLLIARLRAERQGKARLVARINSLMEDMHMAIDQVTGTPINQAARGSPCNRSVQVNLAR
ncbi:MAG: hypothetical protein K2X27_01435 [Candidatus Obscuribacterales bacterium]|nr:hypothetical protein [Candidatus Obscuribacterales bacterium]